MSLFLIRSTLRGGWAVGLAIGAGIALVDALYAACGAAGAAPLLAIDAVHATLGLIGAAVLVALGARTLYGAFRVRHRGAGRYETNDALREPQRRQEEAHERAPSPARESPAPVARQVAQDRAQLGPGARRVGVGDALVEVLQGQAPLLVGALQERDGAFARV